MATLKRQKADGTWEYVEVVGGDVVSQLGEMKTQVDDTTSVLTPTGTANAITLPITLTNGKKYSFKATANSTGAVTINGKAFKKLDGTVIGNGGVKANKVYDFYYDNSQDCVFILAKAEGDATVANVLAGKVFSNGDDVGLVGTLTLKDLINGSVEETGVATTTIGNNDLISVEKYKALSNSYNYFSSPLLGEYRLHGFQVVQVTNTMFISYGVGTANNGTLFINTHTLSGTTLTVTNKYTVANFGGRMPILQFNSDKSKCIILHQDNVNTSIVSIVANIDKTNCSIAIGSVQTSTHANLTTPTIQGVPVGFIMLNDNYGILVGYTSNNYVIYVCIQIINDIVTITQVLTTTMNCHPMLPSITKVDNNTVIMLCRKYNDNTIVYYQMIKLNSTTFNLSPVYQFSSSEASPVSSKGLINKIVSTDENYYYVNIYILPYTPSANIRELKLKVPKSTIDNSLTYIDLISINSASSQYGVSHHCIAWINSNDIITFANSPGITLGKFNYYTKQDYGTTALNVTNGYNTNNENMSMIPFMIDGKPYIMVGLQTTDMYSSMYNAIYVFAYKHNVSPRGVSSATLIPAVATNGGVINSDIKYITT